MDERKEKRMKEDYEGVLIEIYETKQKYGRCKDEYKIISEQIEKSEQTASCDDLTILMSKREFLEIQIHTTSVTLKELRSNKSLLEKSYLFPDHVILRKLGKGSYGHVYASMKNDKLFVLKTILSSTSTDDIPHEVAMMKQLQHIEGVPKLCDFYTKDKWAIIVMDYLPESVDLLEWYFHLNGVDVEDRIMYVFKKLVTILIEIDRAGFVHRDIKLENVIIDCDMSVRVIDFEHCIEKNKEPFTRFNGTISYYPPEWFQYGKCDSEPMTVWSLGVLLYKLLTGYNPFPNVHKFDPGFKRVYKHRILMENLFKHDPNERISLVDILKLC